jgi:hypothetical protein
MTMQHSLPISRTQVACPILLILATVVVFWRTVHADFVLWDDEYLLFQNPFLNPVTTKNLLRFWTSPYMGMYNPLTYTVWAGIIQSVHPMTMEQGSPILTPQAFHVANLIVHVLNALLVFIIMRRLVGKEWAACAGALLFALHPVQVEPVAWVTGMKELLCGFFSLLALWQYLAFAQTTPSVTRRRVHYVLATFCFLLALLSKPSAAAVPLMAWALDRWMVGRNARQCAAALVPWLAAAGTMLVVMKFAQPNRGLDFLPPLWARPMIASDAVGFYLLKVIVPMNLAPDYGRTSQWVLQTGWAHCVWLIPCAFIVLVWRGRKSSGWLLAATGVFVAGVLPVLGLVPFDYQNHSTVADRYLYLSMLAPAFALSHVLSQPQKPLIRTVCVLGFLLLGFISTLQASFWHNTFTLFHRALQVNPRSYLARNNMAVALQMYGEHAEAVDLFSEALRLKPNNAVVHYNLGRALEEVGRRDEAIAHYKEALRLKPKFVDARRRLMKAMETPNDERKTTPR